MNRERKESVAVVGAGSWGTAFAAMLAGRHESVTLWAYEAEVCADLRDRRENRAFLPGIALSPAIRPTNDLAEAVSGKTAVIFAVPSHHLRQVAARAAAHLSPDACLVSLAKGMENGTLKRMTEVLAEASPGHAPRIAALSGPTFAREVAEGKPTGATVAARDLSVARRLQRALYG
ncbi:NAD(P)H-dependent glycerol-3-phosphate dehydrogenase, partial [Candidatus Deferrimicrobium sp.]|uniref:NAD(P)H-dependent glycerol-3-phosphate dehydrogenase n=1 Tax=Candidatus Deferrimicrobium sp. TaxID=3060586 RepID=UPI002ED05A4C